jgi:calcium-dependent protein kinase
MKVMDHTSNIKLYETFEDERNFYLVMELCAGGELFQRILAAGRFKEADAAIVMQQILRAVFYMHQHDICHRDLKPENFLFMSKENAISDNVLKLIDFGLSNYCNKGQVLSTKAGTPHYVAPQVLLGKYDRSCDVWSCGVIMFTLLCGYPPFWGRTDAQVLSRVRQGVFQFEARDWKHISEDAKDLVRMLLKVNSNERLTAEQGLNHTWIRNKAPRSTKVSFEPHFLEKLRNFRSQNKLMKASLHVIAGQLNEVQIRSLRETYNALDSNGDGLLSASELKEGFKSAGLEVLPPELREIMDGVDVNGSGLIDYTEFLAAAMRKKQYVQEDACWRAFTVFDRNGDGKISMDELKQVLCDGRVREATCPPDLDQVMKEVDENGDGSIDFEEFMAMLRSKRACLPGEQEC